MEPELNASSVTPFRLPSLTSRTSVKTDTQVSLVSATHGTRVLGVTKSATQNIVKGSGFHFHKAPKLNRQSSKSCNHVWNATPSLLSLPNIRAGFLLRECRLCNTNYILCRKSLSSLLPPNLDLALPTVLHCYCSWHKRATVSQEEPSTHFQCPVLPLPAGGKFMEVSSSQKEKIYRRVLAMMSQVSQNPVSYTSFVSALSFNGTSSPPDFALDADVSLPNLPCSRYLSHMHLHEQAKQSLYAQKEAQRLQQLRQQQQREAERRALQSAWAEDVTESQAARSTSRVKFAQEQTPPPVADPEDVAMDTPPSPSPSPPMAPWAQHEQQQQLHKEQEEHMEEEEDPDFMDEPLPILASDLESLTKSLTEASVSDVAPPVNRTELPPALETQQSSPLPPSPPEESTAPPQEHKEPEQSVSPKPRAEVQPKVPPGGNQMKRPVISKSEVKHSKVVKPGPKPVRKAKATKKQETNRKKKSEKAKVGVRQNSQVALHPGVPLALLADTTQAGTQGSSSTNNVSPPDGTSKKSRNQQIRWRARSWQKLEKYEARSDTVKEPVKNREHSRKTDDWIYDNEDFSPEPAKPVESKAAEPQSLPCRTPSPVKSATPVNSPVPVNLRLPPSKSLPDWARHRWGPKHRDRSLAEELRRQELAEERRKKAQEMYESIRKKRHREAGDLDLGDNAPRFEDYGFLAKYCIFDRGSVEMYKKAFDVVDEGEKGWLTIEESIVGLRALNSSLTDADKQYLLRILELTGYKPTAGADFKLFAVMAALSQKITALDEWMKNILGRLDFHMLETKMFMCKTLWECNVDPDTNRISLDQLCVELRAGGISAENERDVRKRLGHMTALDLLDFLTYVPLFIMVHESVVSNPLDDCRDK